VRLRYLIPLLLCSLAWGQGLVVSKGTLISNGTLVSPGVATTSNIAFVQSVACNNGTGATTVVCTVTALTTAEFIEFTEEDADNPAAPGLPTGGCNVAWVQDGTFSAAANGRVTVFSCTQGSAGATTITGHPATSTHSSANARVYTGMATSSPLAFISPAYASTVAVTNPFTNTESATQTDLAIAICSEGTNANAHYVLGPGYANLTDFPQPNDLTDTASEDVVNAKTSQWTGSFTADSHNYNCLQVLYKAAQSNNPPSGNQPSFYTDFENSTDGTTVTPTILNSATHGGNCTWTVGGAAFTVATLGEKPTVLNQTVNGVTYTAPDAGTRGIRYDPGLGGATGICTFLISQPSATAGIWWESPATVPDTTTHSFLTVGGVGAADYSMCALAAGASFVVNETFGGDSAGHINIAASTWYRATVQYIAGGTHSCSLYDINGTLVGTASHAATGNNNAINAVVGNNHGGAGNSGNFAYEDNLVVDYINGSTDFPLIP
jgi:hypothetical protein